MASIIIAMRHSQGVTLQYVSLSVADKAAITTRLAIDAYRGTLGDAGKTPISVSK